MSPQTWQEVKRIFAEALEVEGGVREEFVRHACKGRTDLLGEVEAMLREAGHSGPLDSPPLGKPDGSRPEARRRFADGELVGNRYRIERFLAAGGMGEVYEAEDVELGERVALKAIRPEIASQERVLAMFKQEIRLARRVTHPNVCRVYDLTQPGDDGGTALLSMELLLGETLAEKLRRDGSMACREALPILEQVAEGLQAAHDRGIVHRDLKPGNIMLVSEGGESGPRAVVTDFGLAFSPARGGTVAPGGTPGYAAPEQTSGGPGTAASDIYALGMIVDEMIGTGEKAGTRRELAQWRRVGRRCREADPSRRYARATDVKRDLRRSLGRDPRRWAIGAAAALAIAAMGAVRWGRPTEPVWLLVTALQNQSGEAVLDGAVPYLLERDIGDSGHVYVAPAVRVSDTLRLMRHEPRTPVESAIAREVCLRDGGIQLIVNSRAQKIGSSYLVAVDVMEAANGRMLGGASAEAARVEQVPSAIGRLALQVRRIAGESAAGLQASEVRLQQVTTPSLRACQLYSQAYNEVQPVNWPVAERLAREALAEDSQFASAHLWLAWALLNLHKSEAEVDAHLGQAIAYSGSATDRERQFILASEKTIHGQYEEAIPLYRRMLVSYPNDFWSRNNLVIDLLRTGRPDLTERYQMSDLRPKDLSAAVLAMRDAMLANDTAAVKRYRTRAEGIARDRTPNDRFTELWAHTLADFRLHELWLADNPSGLLAEVERFDRSDNEAEVEVVGMPTFYEALGRMQDAERAIRKQPARLRDFSMVALEYLRDRPAELRDARLRTAGTCCDELSVLLATEKDWTPEEYEAHIRRNQIFFDTDLHRTLDANFAAIRGDLEGGALLYRRWPLPQPLQTQLLARFVLAMRLARAHETAGRDEAALRALEVADRGPLAVYEYPTHTTAPFWQRLQYERARLLQKLGRTAEAEGIEARLRRNLRLADRDDPLVVRLSENGRRPLEVY
jgi:Protein kinase domain